MLPRCLRLNQSALGCECSTRRSPVWRVLVLSSTLAHQICVVFGRPMLTGAVTSRTCPTDESRHRRTWPGRPRSAVRRASRGPLSRHWRLRPAPPRRSRVGTEHEPGPPDVRDQGTPQPAQFVRGAIAPQALRGLPASRVEVFRREVEQGPRESRFALRWHCGEEAEHTVDRIVGRRPPGRAGTTPPRWRRSARPSPR